MSIFKPNYTPKQRVAINRGADRARKFTPALGGTARAIGTAGGKMLGKVAIKGQKKPMKVIRRFTQGFN